MPAMPQGEGIQEGILRGIYKYKAAEGGKAQAQLFGSGAILNEAVRAQQILAEKYKIAADVWSVTSYNELRRDALQVERWNRLHPGEKQRTPYVVTALGKAAGPIIAASDYMKSMPDNLGPVARIAPGVARHRWLWPLRQSRASAPSLRSGCRVDRRINAFQAGPRRRHQGRRCRKGLCGTWIIHRRRGFGPRIVPSATYTKAAWWPFPTMPLLFRLSHDHHRAIEETRQTLVHQGSYFPDAGRNANGLAFSNFAAASPV